MARVIERQKKRRHYLRLRKNHGVSADSERMIRGRSDGAEACHDVGIDAYFPILRRVGTLEEALVTVNAVANLKATVEQVFRAIQACKFLS